MEVCEVNLHTNGGQEYLENAVKYPIDERRVLAKGFGVTTHDPDIAVMQFSKTAKFYYPNNKERYNTNKTSKIFNESDYNDSMNNVHYKRNRN